jgi:hypothetical protein
MKEGCGWDSSKPTHTVNFLDMTISIQDSIISTKTYQKEGNPYLYINPSSAHPPGMIKGVIFGSIKCYFEQNSSKEDLISITKLDIGQESTLFSTPRY